MENSRIDNIIKDFKSLYSCNTEQRYKSQYNPDNSNNITGEFQEGCFD